MCCCSAAVSVGLLVREIRDLALLQVRVLTANWPSTRLLATDTPTQLTRSCIDLPHTRSESFNAPQR